MSRITPLPAGGLFRRLVYWLAKRRLGKLPEPVTVMAHHPRLLMAYGAFELGLERLDAVPAALKALAEMRAATLIGCPF